MRELLPVLLAFLYPLFALAMLVYWTTALVFFAVTALIIVLAVVRYEKHQHSEYDDRLSSVRVTLAFEKYLEEVEKRK